MVGDLLERERELRTCAGALADGRAGRGGLVLVEGPAGAGKTGLVTAAINTAAAAGMRVLRGRAAENERAFAFGVVRQLLAPVLGDRAARARVLTGAAALAAPVLDLAGAGDGDPTEAVLHGLFFLLVSLAAQAPLLVTVDDLHWSDDASHTWLAYLARRIDGLPVTLLLAARPREPGASDAALDAFAGEPSAHRLRPPPLSQRAVGQLVEDRLGPPDDAFTAACHAASGGNPFLVGELLGELAFGGTTPDRTAATGVAALRPEGVMRALTGRLQRLPAPTAAVLRALTVLGDGAPEPLVATLAGAPGAAPALEELERLGLVTRTEAGPALAHPLVRAAAERALVPAEAGRLHRRAADLRGGDVERAALHLLHVEPAGDPGTVATLAAAAERAAERAAPDAAATLLRRALAEPPAAAHEGALQLALGRALAQVDRAHAPAALDAALARAATPEERAEAAALLASVHLQDGHVEDALGALDRGLAAAAGAPGEVLRLRVERLTTLRGAVRPIDPSELAALERDVAGSDPGLERSVMGLRAMEHIVTGDPADLAVAAARAALSGPAQSGLAHDWAGVVLALGDALADTEAHHTAEIAAARRRGSIQAFAVASVWRGFGRLRRGDLAGAEEDCGAALDAGLRYWLGGPAACGTLIEVHLARGDLASAHAVSERARTLEADAELPDDFVRTARAELALAEHRPADALALAYASRDHLARTQPLGPGGHVWETAAVAALVALGRRDEARELADVDLAAARRFGGHWRLGASLFAAAGAVDGEARQALLAEALAAQRAAGARLATARTLLASAAGLEPAAARDELEEAVALAEECGATAVAGQALDARVAAGARPRRPRTRGTAALTGAERGAARLAAEGASNNEIAAALFVSPKTVEKHLSAAYRKLGVRSRTQLAAALSD